MGNPMQCPYDLNYFKTGNYIKTIIAILLIYLFALKTQSVEKIVLIKDNRKANIILTDSLLKCESVLGLKLNTWSHWHKIELKDKIIEYSYVPFSGTRIEIKVYKY